MKIKSIRIDYGSDRWTFEFIIEDDKGQIISRRYIFSYEFYPSTAMAIRHAIELVEKTFSTPGGSDR